MNYIPERFKTNEQFNDSLSSISFCSISNMFACTTWDGELRIYDLIVQNSSIQGCMGINKVKVDCPILCSCWSKDGQYVFIGCADGSLRMCYSSGSSTQLSIIGKHDNSITCICSLTINNIPCVCSGSLDSTLRFWDAKSSQSLKTIRCNERITSLCYQSDILLFSCFTSLFMINISNLDTIISIASLVQGDHIKKCCISPDQDEIICCCDNSRCGVSFNSHPNCDFVWKAHKKDSMYYPVNDLAMLPNNAFITCGGDGGLIIWNAYGRVPITRIIDTNHRNPYEPVPSPITAMSISPQANYLVYATGYDWSMGDPSLLSAPYNMELQYSNIALYIQYITPEMYNFNRSNIISN